MVFIYVIEDINDLKYVGSTKQKLSDRLKNHRNDQYRNHGSSSSKLHLEHSIIYQLEECSEDLRKEREKYWINKIDCVNILKYNGTNIENKNEYGRKYSKEYREKNREKVQEYMKIYSKERYKNKSREQKEKDNARRRELRKLKKGLLN